MKLVLINSTGPMGSSLLAAIIEKFGYSNMPVRKLALDEYIIRKRNLQDNYFKERVVEVIKGLNEPIKLGGVSVSDRDSTKAIKLVDANKFADKINYISNNKYTNISRLYCDARNMFADAACYKSSVYNEDWHIELLTEFYKYPDRSLYDKYLQEFGDVFIVHVHRDFISWLESLASQHFSNRRIRYLFVFRWACQQYQQYERSSRALPGLHVQFDSLFIPNVDKLIQDISQELGQAVPNIVWGKEKYDLFGNIKDYDEAFTRADTKGKYLSRITRLIANRFSKAKRVTYFHDVIFYIFYIFDMLRFFVKIKLGIGAS